MDRPKGNLASLYWRAFANQYNMILLGSTGLFSLTTSSWLPLLVGGGMEILWLVLGPDTRLFKRWVASQESAEERERLLAQTKEALQTLDPWYVNRFTLLQSSAEEIQSLAGDNHSLDAVLIRDEMNKLGRLLHSYLRMATVHQRLRRFLDENHAGDMERELAQVRDAFEREASPQVKTSLRQAAAICEKRVRQRSQIDSSCKALGVQMDTLEKALSYLKSQILNIGTGEELSTELDNLMSGVEAVQMLDSEVDEVIADSRANRAAQAARAVKA